MDLKGMWDDAEGKIWFKALVSFIIFIVMSVWAVACVLKKDFLSFEFTHVVMVLGGLGIVTASQYLNNKGSNEISTTSVTTPAPTDNRPG